jgi:ATP-dependent exoDNAse (exonuclease V) beta subunit
MTKLTIIPESLEVANVYLETGDIQSTADNLGLPLETVTRVLNEKQVKDYINQVYLDTGYRNRFKLTTLLDEMIESKLEEAKEFGHYTKADLLDLMKFSHQLRMDQAKIEQTHQTNVQINEFGGGGNYNALMEKLLK